MTKGEDTRREIVEKAAPLFNQKGFEGTSLSDLMRVTGLQKGGIYRHFSSKEELAGEAFDYAWQKAVERRLEGVDEAADAGVAFEIRFDVGAGFLLIDVELRGQAEGGDAVDDAEVDGLGAGAGLLI